MKRLFPNCLSLVENLREKAKDDYPLLIKLYLPIIEKHANRYPSFVDFDYWLSVPYFQYLWQSTDSKFGLSRKLLNQIEEDLERIYKALGDKGFETLCSDFLEFGLHPTVNGVHNKILDFYGELKSILHFIDNQYSIKRILRRNEKTPDFIVCKGDEVAIVECKFIHASNPVRSFIKRYIMYRDLLPELKASDSIKPWHHFYYSKGPRDLSESNIRDLTEFLDQIIVNKPIFSEVCLKENCKVTYERKETIESCPVTIKNQVEFFKNKLKKFLDDYVIRRANQATPQLTDYAKGDQNEYIYFFIELDQEYNLPYKEMDNAKKTVLEDFRQKHNLDVEIILDVFPP